MIGIYGYASRATANIGIRAILDRIGNHDGYRDELYEADGVGLRSRSFPEGGPCLYAATQHPEGVEAAVIVGEVYDADLHWRRLGNTGKVSVRGRGAELCLLGYKARGDAFFANLDGKFSVAIWQPHIRRVILAADRFGMWPLYYVLTEQALIFASELKAILKTGAVPRRIAGGEIAEFVAFGQLVGGATMIEGVRRLPPAGLVIYDTDTQKLRATRYWDARSLAAGPIRPPAEALNRIEDAFIASVRRCTDGAANLGLSLSGGLDSRTILAAVPRDQALSCVTLGLPGGMDIRHARRLSQLLDQPFHPCLLNGGFLEDYGRYLRQMIYLTDGQVPAAAITMPSLDLYRGLGIGALLRGHAGELMHMDKAYSWSVDAATLATRDAGALRDRLFRRMGSRLFSTPGPLILTERYRSLVVLAARAAFDRLFGESNGIEPPAHRLWLALITQFLPYAVAPSIVKYASVTQTRLPYVDADLITALLSAPPDLKFGDQIQAHIVRRTAPALLRVPNSNTGAPLAAGALRVSLSRFTTRALAKLQVPGYQPYERLGLWLRRELKTFVESVLFSERCLDRGIIERTAVRGVIKDHIDGRRNHTYLILFLISLELSMRQLIDGESVDISERSPPTPGASGRAGAGGAGAIASA
jgi:asparagine synthase (glutamine-hydrolysing)